MKYSRILSILIIGFNMLSIAESATLLNLDFENTNYEITPLDSTWSPARHHLQQMPINSSTIKMPLVNDHGTGYSVFFGNQNPENLTINIHSRVDTNSKDKIELAFVDKNNTVDLRVNIDEPNPKRYLAFDIKFSSNYQLSKVINNYEFFLIHFQGLQLLNGAHPPFSMRAVGSTNPMGPINLKFLRSTDSGEYELPGRLNNMLREQWYRIIFQLIPAYEGKTTGAAPQIALWHWNLNQEAPTSKSPTFVWRTPWGYAPTSNPTSKLIQYSMGIYRRSQERFQEIQLKNIKYGHNMSDVTTP